VGTTRPSATTKGTSCRAGIAAVQMVSSSIPVLLTRKLVVGVDPGITPGRATLASFSLFSILFSLLNAFRDPIPFRIDLGHEIGHLLHPHIRHSRRARRAMLRDQLCSDLVQGHLCRFFDLEQSTEQRGFFLLLWQLRWLG